MSLDPAPSNIYQPPLTDLTELMGWGHIRVKRKHGRNKWSQIAQNTNSHVPVVDNFVVRDLVALPCACARKGERFTDTRGQSDNCVPVPRPPSPRDALQYTKSDLGYLTLDVPVSEPHGDALASIFFLSYHRFRPWTWTSSFREGKYCGFLPCFDSVPRFPSRTRGRRM